MWYIRLLKKFLGDKVQPSERKKLHDVIDSVFDTYLALESSPDMPEFECILHVLCFMKRIYSKPLSNQISIDKIREYLEISIVVAEKVCNDDDVWLLEFSPDFGSIETLKKNERRLLMDELDYHTTIDIRDLTALFAIADPAIIAEFKFSSVLECLSSSREELNSSSENKPLLDRLLTHPVLVDKNISTFKAVTQGLKLIKRCQSVYDLNEIEITPSLLKTIKQLFIKYKHQCQQQPLHINFFKHTHFFIEKIELTNKINAVLDNLLTAADLFKLLGVCVIFDQQDQEMDRNYHKNADPKFDSIVSKAFKVLEKFIATCPTISSQELNSNNHRSIDTSPVPPQNASSAFS